MAQRPPTKPLGAGGTDLIIGQVNSAGRCRSTVLTGSAGSQQTLETTIEWVTPTGRGYFVAPTSAVRDVLAAT